MGKNRTYYPYARTSALESFFELITEERAWKPKSISPKTLKSLRIASSKEEETLGCLRFLGMIDSDGIPTEGFSALRKDFQAELGKMIRQAYAEIFDQIPIRRVTQETLVQFFKGCGYVQDTAEYQGALFVYLCQKAGIALQNATASFKRERLERRK